LSIFWKYFFNIISHQPPNVAVFCPSDTQQKNSVLTKIPANHAGVFWANFFALQNQPMPIQQRPRKHPKAILLLLLCCVARSRSQITSEIGERELMFA